MAGAIKIRPADEKVATGMAGELKSKRKAPEAAAGETCAAKRKVSAAAAVEHAPEKKMTRLSQEEVERVLAHVVNLRAPHYVESLKRQNPSLLPSPEEEADRSKVLLYTAARAYCTVGERFYRFQAFVRREFENRGYVEVDEEFLARRAQVKAWNDAGRARALKALTDSDSDED